MEGYLNRLNEEELEREAQVLAKGIIERKGIENPSVQDKAHALMAARSVIRRNIVK